MDYVDLLRASNVPVFQTLMNIFKSKKIAHAYIFAANKNVDISIPSLAFISGLISDDMVFEQSGTKGRDPLQYSDYHLLDASNDFVKKEEVLDTLNTLQSTALDSKGVKILHIKNVEKLSNYSVNALLKYLEEPQKNSYIIITTNNMKNVLDTIKSRCQTIRINSNNNLSLFTQLTEGGMNRNHAHIFCDVYNDYDEINTIYSDGDFANEYTKLFLALYKAIDNVNFFSEYLFAALNKKNYKYLLQTLYKFFQDILNYKTKSSIFYVDQIELLSSYIVSKYNVFKAMQAIDDFIVSQESNVNFDLYKAKLIIELEVCRG